MSSDAGSAPPPAAEGDKKKPVIARLPKPDKEKHQAELKALEATIEAKKARVAEIKAALDGRAEARKAGSPEVVAARAKMSELRDQFKAELVRLFVFLCVGMGVRVRARPGAADRTCTRRTPPQHRASPTPAPPCLASDRATCSLSWSAWFGRPGLLSRPPSDGKKGARGAASVFSSEQETRAAHRFPSLSPRLKKHTKHRPPSRPCGPSWTP
jgi:hypothetical protein